MKGKFGHGKAQVVLLLEIWHHFQEEPDSWFCFSISENLTCPSTSSTTGRNIYGHWRKYNFEVEKKMGYEFHHNVFFSSSTQVLITNLKEP